MSENEGGPVESGKPYIVGVHGPELFVPVDPGRVVTAKKADTYRITRYSLFWLLIIPTAVGYEIWALVTSKDGGALSHVVWWAYGDRWSAQWWFVGSPVTAFLLWCAVHFLFGYQVGLRHLIAFVAAGLLIGLAGYLFTR